MINLIRLKLAVSLLVLLISTVQAETKITVLKTPNGGIQPQAVMDDKGNLHLIYYSGDPMGGNLFYVVRFAGKEEFSKPLQVNSVQASAISAGTIRGGQIALGKNNRVHVSWNGTKVVKGNMEYARLNDEGSSFETEQGLMQETINLDGGGSVAADKKGNVYVAWHGNKKGGNMAMEDQRQVWIAVSKDEGKTFAKEIPVSSKLGVCACCQMRLFVDNKETIEIMYRSASNGNRDVNLLFGKEGGINFQGGVLHPWKVATCPMSSMAITENADFVVATWETDGNIFFSKIKPGIPTIAPVGVPISSGLMGGGKNKKHPSVAINNKEEMVIAWTEGTGWSKGGDLVWQLYDNKGNLTSNKGRIANGIPVWGLVTIVAFETDFIIIH